MVGLGLFTVFVAVTMSLMALLMMLLAAEETTPSLLMILGWICGAGFGEAVAEEVFEAVCCDEGPALIG